MIEISIPHNPVAWQRAGVRWTHQGPKHYTRAETRAWEELVAVYARSAMRSRAVLSGAVDLRVRFLLPIPQGWPQWKRSLAAQGLVVPTSKPDLDNLEKGVKDALNGVVWGDDACVVDGGKSKRYCTRPRVEIEVIPLDHLLPAQVSRRPKSGEHHVG